MLQNNGTIAAIATPPGNGGVGIVRISGGQAPYILRTLFRRSAYEENVPWQSHRLYVGNIIEPKSGAVLDQALAVLMPAPHSYTREDVVELHCHGGGIVLAQVLEAVLYSGARLAERGEFTLRAFLNGALALDEAEAVADLIAAPTARGARLAAKQLTEGMGKILAPLEKELLDLLAELTVGLDFPEDADAPEPAVLLPRVEALSQHCAALLASAEAGRIYREGYKVVLAGASNVGKSSLLNRLLGLERAIVSSIPGTTRDIIEESFNLEGIPIVLLDTAGLRQDILGQEAVGQVEAMGMERSRQALDTADLALVVIDGSQGLDATAQELLAALPQRLLVRNKADLPSKEEVQADVAVSAKTGAGLEELLQLIKAKAMGQTQEIGREPLLANARHKQALLQAAAALEEAGQALADGLSLDIIAIDLENALSALGEISGKTVSEEVISNIFANFCIGK